MEQQFDIFKEGRDVNQPYLLPKVKKLTAKPQFIKPDYNESYPYTKIEVSKSPQSYFSLGQPSLQISKQIKSNQPPPSQHKITLDLNLDRNRKWLRKIKPSNSSPIKELEPADPGFSA